MVEELEGDPWRTSNCAICQERKATQLAKNAVSQHGKRPCEMIHSDISGPFQPSALLLRLTVTVKAR